MRLLVVPPEEVQVTLRPSTSDPVKLKARQLREQGFADGKVGRRMRWPLEAAYKLGYRRGVEARKETR